MKMPVSAFSAGGALTAILLSPAAIAATAHVGTPTLAQRNGVQEVAQRLEGVQESTAQALRSRSEFIPVRLTQCRVRVIGAPGYLTDGSVFLYTEQAVTYALKGPYRQRFTRLSPVAVNGWQVTSTVYRPAGADALTGLCDRPEAERVLNYADIGERECTVYLKKSGDTWSGLTPGRGCESEYRGAVRVTSKVSITREGMTSWDQGWAADETQAWGAETGPYQFRHIDVSKVDADVDQISWRLSGHFNNDAQVKADPSYAPVDYVLCPVRIEANPWEVGTRSTLVTQTIKLPSGKVIVRKRVYVVRPVSGTSREMDFWDLSEKSAAVDTCAQPSEVRSLAFADLSDSKCPMDFAWDDAARAYVGSTREGGCASNYQGSQTLTIKGTLGGSQLAIWERWLDANGNQVAGSKVGPYVYDLLDE